MVTQTVDQEASFIWGVQDLTYHCAYFPISWKRNLFRVENETTYFYPQVLLDVTDSELHAHIDRAIQRFRGIAGSRLLASYLKKAFSVIDEVDSIYVDENQEGQVITVFLSKQEYDETLMDELLDRELGILDELPPLILDFRYIPLLDRKWNECVSDSAEMVYSRDLH